jgi:hypothetical protein
MQILNSEHARTPQLPNNPNAYRLSSTNGHDFVITAFLSTQGKAVQVPGQIEFPRMAIVK